jgi:hypothetical protein
VPLSIPIEIPRRFQQVRYDHERYPGAPRVSGVVGGANCQQYAYEFLRAFGYAIPDFRSSNLWADTAHSEFSKRPNPFDQTASPPLMEVRLSETFIGDIDGESTVRALEVLRDDQSACLVSVQRFRGKLGGRQGTFVLQGSEIVENGNIKATWFVVPGSGTGDLSGLRGEGGFEGRFGKGSDATLDYWFE